MIAWWEGFADLRESHTSCVTKPTKVFCKSLGGELSREDDAEIDIAGTSEVITICF